MITDIYYVIPEIFISLSLMFLLLLGVFKKNGTSIVYSLSLLILISKYLLMRLMEDGSKRTTMTKLN